MVPKKEWVERGFIDEPAPAGTDLKEEIRRMCREKNAVVLAHYYTQGDIQDVADFIGDSLALARKAADTDAKIIVMCGVHFMAETCKILSPERPVLVPDLNAGCSLADSCSAGDLRKFRQEHPGYLVVSYVNTTAAVKALTDVVVTSGNARRIVDTFPPTPSSSSVPTTTWAATSTLSRGARCCCGTAGATCTSAFPSRALPG